MTEKSPSNSILLVHLGDNPGYSDEFIAEITRLTMELAKKQKPLGREFAEIWDKHALELYES